MKPVRRSGISVEFCNDHLFVFAELDAGSPKTELLFDLGPTGYSHL